MSLSVTELNYLIWRYLQEGGLEVSAFALQDETKIDQYDEKYKDRIPLGCLVDLVQKGILYSKVHEMVTSENELLPENIINMNFNLFNSLSQAGPDVEERMILPTSQIQQQHKDNKLLLEKPATNTEVAQENKTNGPAIDDKPSETEDNDFTTVLSECYRFAPSLASEWNPTHPDVLAWGQAENSSGICALVRDSSSGKLTSELKLLPHPVNCKGTVTVSWCPKGHSLMTGSENGELRMWDANGQIRFIMALHRSPVLTVKWSPNSAYLLSLDITNKTIIWDSHTGQSVQYIDNSASTVLPDAGHVTRPICLGTDACWIDETKFVIPGPDYSLHVYQLGDSQPIGVLAGHSDTVSNILYNKELKLLCSSSDDQTVRIWKGNSVNSLQILIGHSQPISYLSWCKLDNGKWCILTCSLDGSLRLWNFYKSKLIDLKLTDNGFPILTAALSADYTNLVTGDSSGTVVVWEIIDDKFKQVSAYEPQETSGQSNFVTSIHWNLDTTKFSVCYSSSESCVIDISQQNK